MGAGQKGPVLAGPSTRETPEKRAVGTFTPLEGTLRVDPDSADPPSVATRTGRRGVNDESGTPCGEAAHGFLPGQAIGEEPAALREAQNSCGYISTKDVTTAA